MDDMKKNWNRLLPIAFGYDHLYDKEQKEITRELNEFYFNNEPLSDANRDNLTNVRGFHSQKICISKVISFQIWSDGYFIGILENVEFRLRDNLRDQTYFYVFSHKGSTSYSVIFGGSEETFYGTSHADELLYLFPLQKTIPSFFSSIPSKEDKELTRLMISLWVNFASTS